MTKKQLPVYLGVAAVWFGGHCGPGVASGNQVAKFYSSYGVWGLFTGILAMIVLGLCVYYSIEYARLTQSYDFKTFANRFFAPYDKFFANFFEITYVATVFLVIGSCIATGAKALQQQFGLNLVVGQLLLCVATILLTIFGAALVRSSSSVMTFLILAALGIIICVGLFSDKARFVDHLKMAEDLPSTLPGHSLRLLPAALWSAVLYAGFQSAGNMANAVSVVEGLRSRKDSIKAAVLGVLLNALLIYGVAFLIFSFPEVLGEFLNPDRVSKSFLPNLEVVQILGIPVLQYLYVTVLLLAILTTLVGFSYAVISRYAKFIPIKNQRLRDLSLVVGLLIICILVSQVGLDAIVGKGFVYLAYACIVVVIVPTIVIGHRKIRALKKGGQTVAEPENGQETH